jgi:hypothetical protein
MSIMVDRRARDVRLLLLGLNAESCSRRTEESPVSQAAAWLLIPEPVNGQFDFPVGGQSMSLSADR